MLRVLQYVIFFDGWMILDACELANESVKCEAVSERKRSDKAECGARRCSRNPIRMHDGERCESFPC